MLDKKDWLHIAIRLDEGRSTRAVHGCGPGKVLIVSHKPHQYDAYCHRCGDAGVESKAESLSERIARRKRENEVDDALASTPALPNPANFDVDTWPSEAKVWLFKGGLGRPEIEALGLYHHAPSNRVVIPVMDGRRVVYWQARATDGRSPKYLNPVVNRQRLVAKFGAGGPLVLTEDALSAYRVSHHCEAWSLLGVKLSDYIAADILKRGGRVLVWLDPDWQYPEGKRPGVIAGKRIVRELRSMGIDAHRIVSRADPKLLSSREIQQHIGGQ